MYLVSDVIERVARPSLLDEEDQNILAEKRIKLTDLCKFVFRNRKMCSVKSMAQQMMLPDRIIRAVLSEIISVVDRLDSQNSDQEERRISRARQIARYAAALSQPFYIRTLSEYSGTPEKAVLAIVEESPDFFEIINPDLNLCILKVEINPVYKEYIPSRKKYDIVKSKREKVDLRTQRINGPRTISIFYKRLVFSYMNEEFRSKVSPMLMIINEIWGNYRKGWPGADRAWRKIVRWSGILFGMYHKQDVMAIADMIAIDPSKTSVQVKQVYNNLEKIMTEIKNYYGKYNINEDDD